MTQRIHFGPAAIGKVGAILSEFSAHRTFVITGEKSYDLSGAGNALQKILSTHEVEYFVTSTSLPELEEIERGIARYAQGSFDLIIAVGGGTVLDIAKLIRIVAAQGRPISDLVSSPRLIMHKGAPLVAIPTTAGSGAEATHFAVLYMDRTKYSIAHPYMMPDIAIVDPDLTSSLPPYLAAVSGLDALSQGIESFWSVNANDQSRDFARQAIDLARRSLVPAVRDHVAEARVNLSLAALLAGQAINISKTTAPHALSYTLTSHFNIPHGHAVSLTIGEFILLTARTTSANVHNRLNASDVQNTIRELCILLDVLDAEAACKYLHELMETLGLRTHLSSLGVQATDFDLIINNVNLERLSTHPCQVTGDDIRTILQHIA
jgi:alcohol dehydrogenase class IV